MRKFLTTGLFGAILGLLVGAPADASLISRSFLDQALTDYATTTALDLKADNADLTNLSNKIGELPSDETVANMLSWQEAIGLSLNYPFVHLLFNTHENSKNPKTVKEAIEVLFHCNSSPSSSGPCFPVMAGSIFVGKPLSDEILNLPNFKNNYPGLTEYKGLLQLTADIGTLPEGITVQGMLDGWTDENGVLANPGLKGIYGGWVGRNGQHTLGLQGLELDSFYTYNPENDSPQLLKGLKGGILNVLSSLLDDYGYSAFGGELAPFWKLTQSAYKTDELSAKIGTLPSGNFPGFPGQESLFPWINQPLTYPTSLAELINAIYGNSETGAPGLLIAIIAGFPMDTDGDGQLDFDVGIRSNFLHARDANNLAKANATKIGTVPDGKNLAGMIGTLPDGYETVGAALTAIKGIAEDAKAAALAAIPDPKTEGSTGKYVLTVDIVGDNATYRWEKIDREGETTTTTE